MTNAADTLRSTLLLITHLRDTHAGVPTNPTRAHIDAALLVHTETLPAFVGGAEHWTTLSDDQANATILLAIQGERMLRNTNETALRIWTETQPNA